MEETARRPLFDLFAGLKGKIPHVVLGALPSPVERYSELEEALGCKSMALYIKRDDYSGRPYGGNKVRKLEFLLADALRKGCMEVLTFGGVGSNHALATGIYAQHVGLKSISMLMPQPNAHSVRANLLMSFKTGIELHHSPSMATTAGHAAWQMCRHKCRTGKFPYVIPPGGTAPLGVVGFVNAALELKQQIQEDVLPVPDILYVASGTMGTAVGLLLGLKAAQLPTKLVAVRVTDARFSSVEKAEKLFTATNRLLHHACPDFPLVPFPPEDFIFEHRFYGQAYGLYTDEAMKGVRLLKETCGIRLEGTYTGKTFAALMAAAISGQLFRKTVVFWNTYNSYDFTEEIKDIDYRNLPAPFHRYFEEEVQPLDRLEHHT